MQSARGLQGRERCSCKLPWSQEKRLSGAKLTFRTKAAFYLADIGCAPPSGPVAGLGTGAGLRRYRDSVIVTLGSISFARLLLLKQ